MVDDASRNIESQEWSLAQAPKTAPWERKTSRFSRVSGDLSEFSRTPWARRAFSK